MNTAKMIKLGISDDNNCDADVELLLSVEEDDMARKLFLAR